MRARVRIVENNTRNFERPKTFEISIWNYIQLLLAWFIAQWYMSAEKQC